MWLRLRLSIERPDQVFRERLLEGEAKLPSPEKKIPIIACTLSPTHDSGYLEVLSSLYVDPFPCELIVLIVWSSFVVFESTRCV